ncbi:TrlF family AAA-like ATPase [Arcticibacter eurypsychrophilus]|uniref:TrlF family AAA-like ATPase n=1 Tax=Arcticibacter eurypsychrophilus TaxID=1434752 RepID=UPI00084D89BC|nr:PHP domain-containing protein [Arcticibacter eurypsychrophilus]
MTLSFSDLNSGAKFVRADMHIHSFGDEGSFDVTDNTMTPENIVDTAIQKKLSIIAITDHNEVGNVKRAVKHAEGKDLIVIPGIEISTTQGHLLIYFENYLNLRNFFGKLTIAQNRETCSQGISECLTLAGHFGGIGILAHIELGSGFEKVINRFGPPMEEIIVHPNLWGLEISDKDSVNFYSDQDSSPDRKRLLNLRREKLLLSSNWEFPILMSSDSHMLTKLGINADGDKRLTRIKMDSLCFHGFKIALQNCTSRIRLENFIPDKTPCFVGIQIDGGLLDQQRVFLNKNLTCIIGGRGAGKSTLLECIRETSGNTSLSSVVDSEVWPDKIYLLYEDEAGQEILLSREKNGEVTNVNDPNNGITKIEIETYGQGETASTVQHSDNDPSSLLKFLDSFIDLDVLIFDQEEVRQHLLINQSEINKLRVDVINIAETDKQRLHYEGKLNQLKKDKVGDLVRLQTALLQERAIRKNIIDDLRKLVSQYKVILEDTSIFIEFSQLVDTEIVVGKENFTNVKRIVNEFSVIVASKSSELKVSLTGKIAELKVQLDEWGAKETSIQIDIDAKRAELISKGIPFDLGKINQIAADVVHYQEKLKGLKLKQAALDQLIKERAILLQKRSRIITKIYQARLGFAITIKENLKNSVDGFFVDLKFLEGKFSSSFEDAIKLAMGWRTSQVPKARLISRELSPLAFAAGVKKGNLDSLKLVIEKDQRIFSDQDITNILQTIATNNSYEDFETIPFDDLPILTVTKLVDQGDGTRKPVSKSIAQLSLGQQQSIILAILLHSKSTMPLLIDQPEDNLDSEFIAKTIVENLKKIKEKRQVIIVTHNANIAVLGDAELIVPLKSTSVKSHITCIGSIDREDTRAICCEVLEGGAQAFKKRSEIYGFKL